MLIDCRGDAEMDKGQVAALWGKERSPKVKPLVGGGKSREREKAYLYNELTQFAQNVAGMQRHSLHTTSQPHTPVFPPTPYLWLTRKSFDFDFVHFRSLSTC